VKPNAPAMVVDALKTWPETVTLPPYVEKASPVELAECRSRLQQIAQCATELRRLVDVRLAEELGSGALRYGDTVLRAGGGYTWRVPDDPKESDQWWMLLASVCAASDPGQIADLLEALYGSASPRIGGLSVLASLHLNESAQAIKETFLEKRPNGAALRETPIYRAPKRYQALAEGEIDG
jgi:hypothetical protein